MTKQTNHIKNLILSALCLAIAMYLPFLTGQIQTIGNMLCPMHIPVFLCAYICGWKWAAAVGLVSPLLRYAAFGMPPIMPIGLGMAFEMMTYGIVAGLLYKILPKKMVNIYVSLIISMIAGRIVWGIARLVIAGVAAGEFTWQMFISGALLTAVPGIILHIILIPIIVIALRKAKLID
ncbi:MAG: ECF transporter S component [Clostridiales bacterium]|nr:ECF transporter S component [Bacillota bacterium]MEE0517844.1 ECF transporter S component [Anaerovoracaceae bacterium]PWL92937.1 MAG: ECF transporter S component [Clostridiales bacterium]